MEQLLRWMEDDEFQLLLDRAHDGDEASFAKLWRHFNPAVVRFLTTLTDRDDATDVTSTVWLEVVRHLDGFKGDETGFRGWLFTIARGRLIDARRARNRRPRLSGDQIELDLRVGSAPDPASVLEGEVDTNAALALIDALPPDQAEVLLLRVIADLDVATVAAIIGKRPGTVRVLAHRGLQRLAAQIDVDEHLTWEASR